MCFELDSVPPIPAIRGAAVSHEDLVLEAADGNSFAAFAATPDESGEVGVVILPDVRGLYRFYEELALRFAAVGFCFGGRNSWLAAGGGHGLSGAVGFYGRPGEGRDGAPGPTQRASELEAPILALQAGADQNISADDNAAFDEALTVAGVVHEVVTYDGAPHSFFDRKQDEFSAASEDAWGKVLAFIERHRSRPAPV